MGDGRLMKRNNLLIVNACSILHVCKGNREPLSYSTRLSYKLMVSEQTYPRNKLIQHLLLVPFSLYGQTLKGHFGSSLARHDPLHFTLLPHALSW